MSCLLTDDQVKIKTQYGVHFIADCFNVQLKHTSNVNQEHKSDLKWNKTSACQNDTNQRTFLESVLEFLDV